MANFFSDNRDISFHLEHKDLREIVELKEDGYKDRELYLEAPADLESALSNYKAVLELTGEIAADHIAPKAEDVDLVGATFKDGQVHYAEGTKDSIRRLINAGLMGFTTPRRFGGLNMPKTIYSMAIELISRADASLMTIFGLQDISETILKYGNEEQRARYLGRFANGEVLGAMALTEPASGSDLGSARLRAFTDVAGKWYLNGVKHFITNGCAQIILVMARSEEDIEDARGLSLFIYERDQNMTIRCIEEKLGIHGSPTCELQFNNAPAELLGERKRGLIKYTMSLMNGARLGVSAQAVGIAEAAYRESRSYAGKRFQFDNPIIVFSPVHEMLTSMKLEIEGARALLYETCTFVDMKEGLERLIEEHPERKSEFRRQLRRYQDYEQLFTPMLKCFATEMVNRVCYDAIQVHGGVGYTRGFAVERLYRDARITSIYEGTTQMQVAAAIGAILKGIASNRLDEYEELYDLKSLDFYGELTALREQFEQALVKVKEDEGRALVEFHGRRLTDMAAYTTMAYLLAIGALQSEERLLGAKLFMEHVKYRFQALAGYVNSGEREILNRFREYLQ